MKLILSGVLENIATRTDGSIKLILGTQEMGTDDAGRLFTLRNKFIKVLLSDSNISPIEENLIDAENIQGGKKAKSHSQRLRSVMFKVHENQGIQTDFEVFYKSEMEILIDKYKEILNND